jgi:hypothetical protein
MTAEDQERTWARKRGAETEGSRLRAAMDTVELLCVTEEGSTCRG